MDFEQAKSIGDVGERAVADELTRLAPEHGLMVLNDLLLKSGPMTGQLDHVVIDKFGVLIVESKVRTNARIKGNDRERNWTAVYPGGNSSVLQNPLRQNQEHENILRKALEKAGNELNPDYVKSAVVFVGADISELKLDSLSRDRVVDVSEVENLIRRRHDFAPNSGGLSPQKVAMLAGLLQGLDQSMNAEVVERHVAYRKGDRSLQSASDSTYATDSTPVVDSRFAGARGRRGARSRIREQVANLVVGAVVLAVTWWLFLGPGLPILNAFLASSFKTDTPPAATAPAQSVSVRRALEVLGEVAPEKVPALVNRDTPLVAQVPQGTTFTWEYVVSNENVAQVSTIAVTLDASGNLVGVDIP